ncbi:hypothetical protein [Amycolatopsis lexingtonensis]|uniref:hypothetical protein n=1 Tax=Amycolatopsis lexingtonensis TaxID=218822 RepID=UPI003F70D4FB
MGFLLSREDRWAEFSELAGVDKETIRSTMRSVLEADIASGSFRYFKDGIGQRRPISSDENDYLTQPLPSRHVDVPQSS